MDEQQDTAPSMLHLTREHIVLAGGTMLTATGVDLFAHLGPTGLVVGGILAFVAARHGRGVYQQVKGALASPRCEQRESRSVLDRALGRFPDDTSAELRVCEPEETCVQRAALRAELEEVDSRAALPEEPSLIIPHAPPFWQMCHLITPERLVLCYTAQGPAYGTIEDLLSMAVVGKPGRGKTTALCYYVALLLSAGAEVHVWDPHGSMNDLAAVSARLHYTDALEDLLASVARLSHELDERSRLYKQDRQTKHPLLLLVDELPVIGDYEKHLKKQGVAEKDTPTFLITRFVLEARKWRCFFIGSGQSTDADILPTRVTENLSSRMVFYASDRRARMAGLEHEVVRTLLPLLKHAAPGVMIFDCSRWDEPVLGAIPHTTVPDVQRFLAGLPQRPVQPTETVGRHQRAGLPEMEALQPNWRTAQPAETSERVPKMVPTRHFSAALTPEVQRALVAYQRGHTTCRTLAAAIGVGKTRAAELIQQLKAKRLIDG